MTIPTRWLALLALLALLQAVPAAADSIEPAEMEGAAPAASSAPDEAPPLDLLELEKHRRERARLYPIGTRISRYLTAASEAMSEGDNEKALTLLERLNPKRLNPYERAYVFRLMAYVHYADANYEAAIERFNQVLEQEALFLADEARIRFNIVQLYTALQKWRDVIRATHLWFRYVPEPSPLSFYLLAIAHYQLDEVDESILYAEKAIDLAPDPQEGWLQLLSALYVQKEDYASAAPVFEELVMRFPKKQYWVQLSLIYGAKDDYRHSLAVQQIAYLQGFLTGDGELRRLARSYLYANLPHEAAKVLEKGLEDGAIEADPKAFELLGNSWIQAREWERSFEPLRKAAELSEDGNLFVRLGQVHMQREEWGEAVKLFHRAVEKGGIENLGVTQLLLGISYYNDHRVDNARSSFARARQHEGTRKQADEWIAHIENESRSG